jgi:uncharacterized protein YybS (DUF2232 family)
LQHRSSGVRGLVFGGIMAALVVVCAMVPILTFFMPIPLVFVYLRFGGRAAVLASIVSAFFAALIVGPVQAFVYLVPSGILPGLVFGYGFRHKWKPIAIGIMAVAIFFVGFFANYVVTRALLMGGRDPITASIESPQGKQLLNTSLDWMDRTNQVSPKATAQQIQAAAQTQRFIDDVRQHPVETTWAFLPLGILLSGTMSAWLNYRLCRWILPRFGHPIPATVPFEEFRLPLWLAWSSMIAGFGSQYLGTSLVSAVWWVKILWNVLPPLIYLVVLAGIAVAYGFLRQKNLPKLAAGALALAGFFLGSTGLLVYVMIALWDTLFDFRGLGHGLFRLPKDAG